MIMEPRVNRLKERKEGHHNPTQQRGTMWKTKLERITVLSKSNNPTIFNNIGHIIDIDMLKSLYQELDGKKAVGIDRITKEQYGKNLGENLHNLIKKIRNGSYRPQAAKIVEIPKEDGSKRPLAISCFEDKLTQYAVNSILNAIYESTFLECSYGFRPKRNCHDALKRLHSELFTTYDGAIVEIDIRKCFDKIPHEGILEILNKRINDTKFLQLVAKLLKTPTVKDNEPATIKDIGCPQGSIISPTLCNIYLHYAIDTWFDGLKGIYINRKSSLIRYCDDMVFIFKYKSEAERFYKVLPKRLNKFGLEMNEAKSSLLVAGGVGIKKLVERKMETPLFKFLGFLVYWTKNRNGYYVPKYRSIAKRLNNKILGLKKFLRTNLTTPDAELTLKIVVSVVRGWINYHAISDNQNQVRAFIIRCKILSGFLRTRRKKHNSNYFI